jgi:uncharacterized protein YbjQ (UPF0145 family)
MNAKELYAEAYKAYSTERNFEKARHLFEKLVSEYPDSQEAAFAKQVLIKMSLETGEEFNPNMPVVKLSTSDSIAGYKITETVEIITAECVFGMNVFKDIMSTFSDIFGGRSKTVQDTFRKARKTCLDELKKEATQIGANGIITVRLNYNEISSQGKGMLFLVASGTAVKIEPLN